jgi:hypothetical protein
VWLNGEDETCARLKTWESDGMWDGNMAVVIGLGEDT